MAFVKFYPKKIDINTSVKVEKCPLCGGIINPKTRHCKECGTYIKPFKRLPKPKPLLKICPNCYHVLPENGYCDNCETKIDTPKYIESL